MRRARRSKEASHSSVAPVTSISSSSGPCRLQTPKLIPADTTAGEVYVSFCFFTKTKTLKEKTSRRKASDPQMSSILSEACPHAHTHTGAHVLTLFRILCFLAAIGEDGDATAAWGLYKIPSMKAVSNNVIVAGGRKGLTEE